MQIIKKRLILAEDINFDSAGTGDVAKFTAQDGTTYEGQKINAAHLPLTKETREKLAALNVDEALSVVKDKVDAFSATDVMTENVTITFTAENTPEEIQRIIDRQKRNLNNYTLTFIFPSSWTQLLYDSIYFHGFFNGAVRVASATAGSKVRVYDQLGIEALFKVIRCQCEVVIEDFNFVHLYSPYGVLARSASSVIINNCEFSGMKSADSYALKLTAATGTLLNCEITDDKPIDDFYLGREEYAADQEANDKDIAQQFAAVNKTLAQKADVDLNNLLASAFELKSNARGMYFKIKNFCIQFGVIGAPNAADKNVDLPIEFANNNYQVFLTGIYNKSVEHWMPVVNPDNKGPGYFNLIYPGEAARKMSLNYLAIGEIE